MDQTIQYFRAKANFFTGQPTIHEVDIIEKG
jgi:hypothetical protein